MNKELKQKTKTISVKIGDIKPYDKNPYKHDAEDITELEYSINNFGYITQIILWKSEILAGHARHIALMNKYPPNTKINVIDASYLNAAQAKKYRIMENESRRGKLDVFKAMDEINEIFPHGLDNVDNIKYETGIDYDALTEQNDALLNGLKTVHGSTEDEPTIASHSKGTGQYILKFDLKDFKQVKELCLFVEQNDFINSMSDIFLYLLKNYKQNYGKKANSKKNESK